MAPREMRVFFTCHMVNGRESRYVEQYFCFMCRVKPPPFVLDITTPCSVLLNFWYIKKTQIRRKLRWKLLCCVLCVIGAIKKIIPKTVKYLSTSFWSFVWSTFDRIYSLNQCRYANWIWRKISPCSWWGFKYRQNNYSFSLDSLENKFKHCIMMSGVRWCAYIYVHTYHW